jgi:hypothetical protein
MAEENGAQGGNDSNAGSDDGSSSSVNNSEPSAAEKAVADMSGNKSVESNSDNTDARPDNVHEKFWNKETKSIRTDELLSSYSELEKKFGSFTGAPEEDYGFTPSEEMSEKLKENGIELNTTDDPLFIEGKKFAKEAGMSQEGFNGLVNLYLMNELGMKEAEASFNQDQIKSLGDRGDKRILAINDWASQNLDESTYDQLKNNLNSADMVPVIEQLISMTRNAPVSDNSNTQISKVNESEVTEMQFAKDQYGNRRIQTDKAFRQQYEQKRDEFYGTEPHNITIGKV